MDQRKKNVDDDYEDVDYETHNIYSGIDEDLYRKVVAKLDCDKSSIVREDQKVVETMEGDQSNDYYLSTEFLIIIIAIVLLLIYLVYNMFKNNNISREDIYKILHQ